MTVSKRRRTDTMSVTSGRSFIGDTPTLTGVGEKGSRGVASVAIILFKTITGAGALAMPRAMHDSGVVSFSLMVTGVGLCSHYGCLLLARSLDMVAKDDIDIATLGHHCMGKAGFTMAMVVCFLDSWGGAVAALRMIAELVSPMLKEPDIFGHDSSFAQEWFVILIHAIVIFPMMLYRDITQLGWINTLGIIAMMVFAGTIVVKAILSGNNLEGRALFEWDNTAIMSIPVIAFSYDCQVNMFGSYRDISGKPGEKAGRLNTASMIANGVASVCYIIIALSGYVTYLDSTSNDVLGNLPSTLDAVKIMFALSVLFSFPVVLLECSTIVQEHVIRPLLVPRSGEGSEDEESFDEDDEPPYAQLVNIFTNLFIISSAATVAAFVPSMYAAFAYVGASTATINTAVIPPLYYLMTIRKQYPGFSILRTHPDGFGVFQGASAVQEEEEGPLLSEEEGKSFRIVAAPPNQWLQRCAAVYLICGSVAMPFLVYVTAVSS
eukprot:TRINITY_DN37537_c0_g1_i1.p1 TRINITY_DN37537_c0_g1~~TRINITY_DN37537_c0_g1_i1.p1  ORF type:complete len:516 (+),score=87.89 TRINITY_DN37537_c0_g1_i1:73-1548(+)